MESLNLNALAGSLPTSNLASAEKELLNNFRGDFPHFLLVPPLSRSSACEDRLLTPLYFSLQSGCTKYNESLSILALYLEARVQLGIRCGLRRPAADGPANRVGLGDATLDWAGDGLGRGSPRGDPRTRGRGGRGGRGERCEQEGKGGAGPDGQAQGELEPPAGKQRPGCTAAVSTRTGELSFPLSPSPGLFCFSFTSRLSFLRG